MSSFDFNSINTALAEAGLPERGVDFSGKSLKLDTAKDAQPIIDAINACSHLHYLTLTGNTLGVQAAEAIAKALEHHPELKVARFSDMFTGRMKTEIPPALAALGDGMITGGARLSVLELSDNAFGPIGVEGLTRLLQSEVCSQLEELRLNNNGLGITGGKLLARALTAKPLKLKVFIAGRNRLENEGATALAKVFMLMGTLEEIAMPQNGIYHIGVSALAEAFKHNPHLRCLNLNDNTIGKKGAGAIAAVLPKLKNLKSINFGDCLLKSKGAQALAQAFKDNSILLEYLDLSHNEIGHKACMEVVNAVTALPDASERLARVVLAGNSFGNTATKNEMKEKLGSCGELSDGENSDDEDDEEEDATDSENEESSDEDENTTHDTSYNSNNSYDSDRVYSKEVQHNPVVVDISNESNTSMDYSKPTIEVPVFIEFPTLVNLKKLGPQAADLIEEHIMKENDMTQMFTSYIEAIFCVSGLSQENSLAMDIAQDLYDRMLKTLEKSKFRNAAPWLLTNCMLVGLGLIKSEAKNHKLRWNTAGCFTALGQAFHTLDFPIVMRDTLRLFISTKMKGMADENIIKRYPKLYEPEAAQAH